MVQCLGKKRLTGLYDKKGKGRKHKLTKKEKKQVRKWAKEFPKQLSKIIGLIKETFNKTICKNTVKTILKSFGISWRRVRKKPKGKPDEKEYKEKEEQLEEHKQNENGGILDLYYFDESGFSLMPCIPYAWQEKGETIEIAAGKSKRLNVVGFMSRKNDLFAFTFECSIDSEIVICAFDRFAEQISKRTVVVIDNASMHTALAFTEKIPEWKEKGLEIFYLPTYSPQLNLIEILWKFMKYTWIEFSAYDSWENLVQYVEKIIINFGKEYQINFC